MFLAAVGFWNFLRAGVFGFLINLPIVSYYEIATALTANHAHASMMRVYGMLAAGLALFALRYLIPKARWPQKAAKVSFWSLNIGLGWMVFVTLFPLGILQLYGCFTHALLSGVRTRNDDRGDDAETNDGDRAWSRATQISRLRLRGPSSYVASYVGFSPRLLLFKRLFDFLRASVPPCSWSIATESIRPSNAHEPQKRASS